MYKLLEITIKPETALGTPFKGDTIFGHFVWQAFYDNSLVGEKLEVLLESYGKKPFIVFSSGCLKEKNGWLMPRPALPMHFFGKEKGDCFKVLSSLKDLKKKRFIFVEEDLIVKISKENLRDRVSGKSVYRVRNSVNRVVYTTGKGFTPYEVNELWYDWDSRFSIFCLFQDEVLSKEAIRVAFERMGKMGFGKDASAGLGKFKVEEVRELRLPKVEKFCYTLSPCIPEEEEVEEFWFLPFVRFGKHGGPFAISRNPFKEPVIMADEGAVFRLKDEKLKEKLPFVGKSIEKISKVCKSAVYQGFSIVFPVRFVSYEGN